MNDVDWFPYFLHPEQIDKDFGPHAKWASNDERLVAARQVLRGLLSATNFRAHVVSAYPKYDKSKDARDTPPSTPLPNEPQPHGSRRNQCAHLEQSDSGEPLAHLSHVLSSNNEPELSQRQHRMLTCAHSLTKLVGFSVEDIELCVHATLRLIYYLHNLEQDPSSDRLFQLARWALRAMYREDTTRDLNCDMTPTVQANITRVVDYVRDMDDGIKFATTYDVARVYMVVSQFKDALRMFNECQRLDPLKCKKQRFVVAGREQPSVDEYAQACATIVETSHAENRPSVETPTRQLGGLRVTKNCVADLLDQRNYDAALRLTLRNALDAAQSAEPCGWISHVHPRVLAHCSRQSADMQRIRDMLERESAEWMRDHPRENMEHTARSVVAFIAGSMASENSDHEWNDDCAEETRTLAEHQQLGSSVLSLDTAKPPLAILDLAHSYLSGLRMLESHAYQTAQSWFTRTPLPQPTVTPSAVTHSAEKDKHTRTVLEQHLDTHARLASICEQLTENVDAMDVMDDIQGVLEAQVPVRFEFVEQMMVSELQHSGSNIAHVLRMANHVIQTPDVHLVLLDFVAAMARVQSVFAACVDTSVEALAAESQSKVDAHDMRAPVVDLISVICKLKGAGAEKEMERLCRAWNDSCGLLLLSAILVRCVTDHEQPPFRVCNLVAQCMEPNSVDDSDTNVRAISRIVTRCASERMHNSAILWLRSESTSCISHVLEFLTVYTQLDPHRLDQCMRSVWFQLRIPNISQSLVDCNMLGAATVVLQCTDPVDYSRALQVADRANTQLMDVAAFIWDTNIAEFTKHAQCANEPERPVVLAAFFQWLCSQNISVK
ncbi:hypothetical protein GGH12_003563 [Coemansia sp. RSA 1822]|nr:hypothetical protein LPJ76_003949 [Coemansia sp. RSA 638]KAJ2542627.1 hypothetical protein GGF49_002715 [Coemansia sp. RSA 1853]KAJ2561994.1 hypothetical protein GGH12_003563 [Coemansia sp. RSA 1822]